MPNAVTQDRTCFTFAPITAEEARAVAEWQYEGELAAYNCPPDEVEQAVVVMMLSGNQYFAAHDDTGGSRATAVSARTHACLVGTIRMPRL
jgi:hypothetical protein